MEIKRSINHVPEVSIIGSTGGLKTKSSEATGTATAASAFDIEVNIPSGAKILGCQLRVDVLLSAGTGVSWSAAYIDGSTQTLGTGLAFAKNTKVNTFFDEAAVTAITGAETDIRVTVNTADFIAGGKITAIVYYQEMTAMGDA